jgi:hypothetical protein
VTVHVIDGLNLIVERGPNWLFVKLRPKITLVGEFPRIADEIWAIATRHFIYRVVLELDELQRLPIGLVGQLVMLQERLAQCGGALKICGLSEDCAESLHDSHLDSALPNHSTRTDAVMGGDLSVMDG